jgi:L-2-hydroxycarboxylate dehydrogenase (NAD+)
MSANAPAADRPIGYGELVEACAEPLQRVGVPAGDARLVAGTLVRAEAEGAVSHGIARLPALLERLQRGVAEPVARLWVARETAATAVVDGGNGLGQVIASRAMRMAIGKASTVGLGAVAVRNSSHFGRAGHWAVMAAERGLIGIAASNASPRLVAGPGMRPVLGNNPWSVAIPADPSPLVIDMANSVVAAGKIQAAAAAGDPIPHGWALGPDGQPTTDPRRALDGALLAAGGHKGWAVSLLVDVLTGVLASGAFGGDVAPGTAVDRPHRSAQLYAAIDVATFIDLTQFRDRVAELSRRLAAAAGPDGRLPGQASLDRLRRVQAEGVRVREGTLTAIERALAELGLPWRLRAESMRP